MFATSCSGHTPLAGRSAQEARVFEDWSLYARHSKNPETRANTEALSSLRSDVLQLMEDEEFEDAENLVDQELSNPLHGDFMARCKAELLLIRSEEADALDMYLDIFGCEYGAYSSYLPELETAFALAVDLDRSADVDTIAQLIIANHAVGFGEYAPLQVPTTGSSADERLAFAYLSLAANAVMDSEFDDAVDFGLSAKSIMPDSPLVLVHVAAAYSDRGGEGDLETCRDHLEAAYEEALGDNELRAEIVKLASAYRVGPFP
jgi:hypothetical protein